MLLWYFSVIFIHSAAKNHAAWQFLYGIKPADQLPPEGNISAGS
jgi:hypothetical protein